MPYRRRYRGRRRRRSAGTSSRFGSALATATKALLLARYVKSLVNSELLSDDTQFNAAVTNTAVSHLVTNISQGDDYNARQGRKIRLKSIQCSGSCTMHATATNTRVRMVLFMDKMNTGTAPTLTDIVSDTVALRNNQPNMMARYKIFWDKHIVMTQITDANTPERIFKYYKKVDIPVTFSGTAGTDEGKNSFWCLLISDESTNSPTVVQNWRVRYRDN